MDPSEEYMEELRRRNEELGELKARIETIGFIENALADAVTAGWLDQEVAAAIGRRITEPEAQVIQARAAALGVEFPD